MSAPESTYHRIGCIFSLNFQTSLSSAEIRTRVSYPRTQYITRQLQRFRAVPRSSEPFDFAFPEPNNGPSLIEKFCRDRAISAHITPNFLKPVVLSLCLPKLIFKPPQAAFAPLIAVPKITVDEYGKSIPRKHNIGLPFGARRASTKPQPLCA